VKLFDSKSILEYEIRFITNDICFAPPSKM
jgi:hypothetical protein